MPQLLRIACPCHDPDILSELARIHLLCFVGEAWTEDQMAGSLALESTCLLLAKAHGKVLGFLLAQNDGEDFEILTFCVDPAHRCQGLGGLLLKKLLGQAPDGGVFLEVASDNAPAQSLYRAAGFDLIGIRKNYYKRPDGLVDAFCFKWQSPDPAC